MRPSGFGGFIAIHVPDQRIVGSGRTLGVARKAAGLRLGIDSTSDLIDTMQATERLFKVASTEPDWTVNIVTDQYGRYLIADISSEAK